MVKCPKCGSSGDDLDYLDANQWNDGDWWFCANCDHDFEIMHEKQNDLFERIN